jgi:hypothetical protein
MARDEGNHSGHSGDSENRIVLFSHATETPSVEGLPSTGGYKVPIDTAVRDGYPHHIVLQESG